MVYMLCKSICITESMDRNHCSDEFLCTLAEANTLWYSIQLLTIIEAACKIHLFLMFHLSFCYTFSLSLFFLISVKF